MLSYSLMVLLVLTMAIFIIRFISMLSVGALFTSTGVEEAPIYSIWKVAHSYPLYEFPLGGNFGLGLYNWLFYMLYGLIIKCLGLDGPALILTSRLITFAFAILGCVGFRFLLKRTAPCLGSATAWILSILLWRMRAKPDGGR